MLLTGSLMRPFSGKVDEARDILKSLEATIPGLAMVRLRRVSLERRHGNMEEAEALLRDAMECGKDTTEMSFYAVKLARHYMKVQKSQSKAKKVLLDAIEKDQVRRQDTLTYIKLAFRRKWKSPLNVLGLMTNLKLLNAGLWFNSISSL